MNFEPMSFVWRRFFVSKYLGNKEGGTSMNFSELFVEKYNAISTGVLWPGRTLGDFPVGSLQTSSESRRLLEL